MKSAGNKISLSISKRNLPKTVSLPISSGDPYEIDTTGELTSQVFIRVEAASVVTWADDLATAKTQIAAGSYLNMSASGELTLEIAGTHTEKVYVQSQGAAVANGLTYALSEFSGV